MIAIEANFETLVENSTDGIFIADKKGNYIYANQRVVEITGYSIPEILNLRHKDLLHPDEITKVPLWRKSHLHDNLIKERFNTRIIHKNGEIIPVDITLLNIDWKNQPPFTSYLS